jgi:hypothetical protein
VEGNIEKGNFHLRLGGKRERKEKVKRKNIEKRKLSKKIEGRQKGLRKEKLSLKTE